MADPHSSLCESLRANAALTEKALDFISDPDGLAEAKQDIELWRAAADEIERNGSVQWGDLASSLAERERAERYRVALQNVHSVVLNGPPDDALGRCDAVDQIVHEALADG